MPWGNPVGWVHVPEAPLNAHIRMMPVLKAEESLRDVDIAIVASADSDPTYRNQTLAEWVRIANKQPQLISGRRADGTWEIVGSKDLIRYLQVEGGFSAGEIA